MKSVAVVLAAGTGKRMGGAVKKQYMELLGHPVLYYTLKAFEESFIDEVVLVTSPDDMEYCKRDIIDKYQFKKVTGMVAGGKERYHSVYNGLFSLDECDYVFIHDGARCFVDEGVLNRAFDAVKKYDAVVSAVKVKDTIKIDDGSGFIASTPDRASLWAVQTPQVFRYELIAKCYADLIENEESLLNKGVHITDDTMAVEYFSDRKVYLCEGSYENIKLTTPEDLSAGEAILKSRRIE